MSRREKLDPKEHVCGEWNIISLNRYLPLSNGDRDPVLRELTPEQLERAALVKKAKELYDTGVSICQIAREIGIAQPLISHWKALEWCVEIRLPRKKKG